MVELPCQETIKDHGGLPCHLRGHETLHNLVDEALLLKEARSWSHANLPYANVFGSFKIRPCCIDQIKQSLLP
uniref:Uncharacterized protein n=1 Tax=Oryza rufipogon TaxID=4529 RepID=A0A0E0NE55_ORYRU